MATRMQRSMGRHSQRGQGNGLSRERSFRGNHHFILGSRFEDERALIREKTDRRSSRGLFSQWRCSGALTGAGFGPPGLRTTAKVNLGQLRGGLRDRIDSS